MKYYSRCFSDKELVSFIAAAREPKIEICKYDRKPDVFIENSPEIEDFLCDFFSLFEESAAGEPLSMLLKSNSLINVFNKDFENIELFWTELLRFLHIGLEIDTPVIYRAEINDYVNEWESIKNKVLNESRFFCQYNEAWKAFFVPNYTFPSSARLYRARVRTDGQIKKFSKKEMAAPPACIAPNGRTNPEGIAYLYLCEQIDTTLYETRAILNDCVSIATFQLKPEATIRIFDFTVQPTFFADDEESCLRTAQKIRLFDAISQDLSRPMRRHSKQLEYLPTQFICEFIRVFAKMDGIAFKSSVHTTGKNIVLFDSDSMVCKKVDLISVSSLKVEWESIKIGSRYPEP